VALPPVEKDGIFYSAGQGAVTTLVCGGLQLEDHTTNPLFSVLPPFLHIQSRLRESNPWLRAIVQLVKAEVSTNQLAAETVITRLSEILFIQAVHTYMGTVGDGDTGWFNALKDPQIQLPPGWIVREGEGAGAQSGDANTRTVICSS
jgi:hypothetical protein